MQDDSAHCVMVFGTFDVFHPGHEYFISGALKKLQSPNSAEPQGSSSRAGLVIVIARDDTVKKIKPLLRNSELKRQQVVQEAFPEAKVILGDCEDPMKVVREYQPDLVCLGYDQVGFSEQLKEDFPEIRIERLEAYQPERYKSSKMP